MSKPDDWAIIAVALVKNMNHMNYLLNSHDYLEALKEIKIINSHLIAMERICLEHVISHNTV
jgi:hypothetical protein